MLHYTHVDNSYPINEQGQIQGCERGGREEGREAGREGGSVDYLLGEFSLFMATA